MQLVENPVPIRSRQSLMALLFIIGTFFRRMITRAWWLFLIALKPNADGSRLNLLFLVVGMITISLVSGIINYFKYYLWLDEDNLYVEQGVIKKSKVAIPFDRIQSINTEQNLLFRVFNIVKLDIDTAGSKGKEVKIHALNRDLANRIHDYVMENKKHAILVDPADVSQEQQEELTSKWTQVMQLDLIQLIKIGLAQNHLRAVFIIIAFAFARFEDARELLGDQLIENVGKVSQSPWFSDVLLLTTVFAFGVLMSVMVSLLTVLTRFYGFKLLESKTGMKTEYGLFTKLQRNLSFKRTQIFQYTAGPVRKWLGLYNVKVFQAAAEGPSGGDAVQIPGCPADQLPKIRARFFEGKEMVGELDNRINKIYIFRKWLFAGLLASIALSVIVVLIESYYLLYGVAAYLVYDLFKHAMFYRSFRFGFSEDLLSIRSGFWILKYRTLQLYKIQAVEIGQGIYQRSKGFADLVLYTAGGSVVIPYIKIEEARMLQNYVLYKVEVSKEKWM